MPAGTLIDRLWDTRPPPKARESLSVYITRLRTSLRQATEDAEDEVRLIGRAQGYVLEVDPEAVDLHQFRRLRRQADALMGSGDYDHAAVLLREADGLWRGQALAGIRGDWVARMRDSLEEERRAAILARVESELKLGRHAGLVSELQGLLAQYPLDETFVAHQMTALYRSGRPSDALSLYRDTRARLASEQGTEPGPELAGLHQRILRRDPLLASETAGVAERLPVPVTPPDVLPPETADFVGRSQQLEQLTVEQPDALQITVIEGMPGVGKTALAVRAARMMAGEYPDGAFYLNFHTHDPGYPAVDSDEALHRLLRMLAVPVSQIPDAIGERAALWRAQLSRRRAVVILDDVARLDQVRPLLPAAGRSLILITARRRLPDLAGSRTLPLDVLSLDDAVALFARIAGPALTASSGQVAEAVALCGRLPLAIQLTAGRLAQSNPPGLADLVDELSQPSVRPDGAGAASPEVMTAFDLSYTALEPDHQRFFRRLGMNPGPRVSLQAAAALGGGTHAEAEKALAALLDHHLLARGQAAEYRFHDLIRGYAAGRAARDDPEPERRQAIGRLLDFYLHTADRADRVLHPFRHRMAVSVARPPAASPPLGTRQDAAGWLEAEWRNILQLAQYAGRHEWKRQCADLVHVLACFVDIRAYWDEAIDAHTMALQASRDLADPARVAQAALELSVMSQQTGRHEAALPLAEEAAAIYRSSGDRRGEAGALDQVGMTHQRGARFREALAYFQEARALYRDAGDQHGLAGALGHSGIACWQLGRHQDAIDHLQDALSLYREVGDRRGEAKTLNNLGKMQLSRGYHRDALEHYQKSLEIFREIGGAQNQAILHHNIGSVYHYKGSYAEGLAACRKALAIYRSIGDLPDEADVLNDIGAIYHSAECNDEALVYHQKAMSIAEEIGNLSEQAVSLRRIADVNYGSGRYGEALDNYRTALRMAREIGDPYEEAKILEGIAETVLITQGAAAARIVFRQALDIFEQLEVPEAESVRIRIDTIEPAGIRHISLSAWEQLLAPGSRLRSGLATP